MTYKMHDKFIKKSTLLMPYRTYRLCKTKTISACFFHQLHQRVISCFLLWRKFALNIAPTKGAPVLQILCAPSNPFWTSFSKLLQQWMRLCQTTPWISFLVTNSFRYRLSWAHNSEPKFFKVDCWWWFWSHVFVCDKCVVYLCTNLAFLLWSFATFARFKSSQAWACTNKL